jgi:bacteriocin biosynthesis cyclodehydratase domain-containing protein
MDTAKRYRVLPAQIIEIEGGLILKRGLVEIHIGGQGSAEAVQTVFSIASNGTATAQEILSAFDPSEHATIERLINFLLERRLLVSSAGNEAQAPTQESHLDLFNWQFGHTTTEASQNLNSKHFAILGVNLLSARLLSAFREGGVHDVDVFDDPALRNLTYFDKSGRVNRETWPFSDNMPRLIPDDFPSRSCECVITTSDFGYSPSLRDWNRLCVQNGRRFFPVVLQDMVGHVGPLVVPHETACFECFLARRDSHLDKPELHRAVDEQSFEGQRVSGFHPSMTSIVAEIAVFELIKSHTPGLPSLIGTYIEVNLLAPRMIPRKVLKLPRCLACSPLCIRPAVTLKQDMFTLFTRKDS